MPVNKNTRTTHPVNGPASVKESPEAMRATCSFLQSLIVHEMGLNSMDKVRGNMPVLVGIVVLDVLHEGLVGSNLRAVKLRWGGVVSNMACALGSLGIGPRFISPSYEGEMQDAAANHMQVNSVQWSQLPIAVPMPLFHARLILDGVEEVHFIGDKAIDALTPEIMSANAAMFDQASAIVSCSDLNVETLCQLGRMAAERDVPYWLLSAEVVQAWKFRNIEPFPDCISLNIGELSAWCGAELQSLPDAFEALQSLLPTGARALLTLGPLGALFVHGGYPAAIYQPATTLDDEVSAIGAGDVMFGSLLAARQTGCDWSTALLQAASRTVAYLSSPSNTIRPYLALQSPKNASPGRAWYSDEKPVIRFNDSTEVG